MHKLLIFDLWNTLIKTRGPRFVERMSLIFSELSGQSISVDEFQDYLRSTGSLHQEIDVTELAFEFWSYRFGTRSPGSLAHRAVSEHEAFVASAHFIGRGDQVLSELRDKGCKIAIVSNATSASVDVIKRLKINKMADEIWLSCKTGFLKPDPRAFASAANHFGCQPSECIVIGDKINTDILGARLTSMATVLIDGQFEEEIVAPNGSMISIIPSIDWLPRTLERTIGGVSGCRFNH